VKIRTVLQVKDSNAIIVIFASSLPTNILFISSALMLEIVLKNIREIAKNFFIFF
jgi:hypothetical protein